MTDDVPDPDDDSTPDYETFGGETPQDRIRFVQVSGAVDFLSYAHLLHFHFEPADGQSEGRQTLDQIDLMFATHQVTLRGLRLRDLADRIQTGTVEWVRERPERFAPLLEAASKNPSIPFVCKISVTAKED